MYMLFCSMQIISRLDSQSKFQMFTLFSGRHVGVPRRYTNMAAPYWALLICAEHFDEYLKYSKTHRLKIWTSVIFTSLRSKRSRTKRMKFHISSRAKNGVRAKRWKEGGGGEERRERLSANPSILKNAH